MPGSPRTAKPRRLDWRAGRPAFLRRNSGLAGLREIWRRRSGRRNSSAGRGRGACREWRRRIWPCPRQWGRRNCARRPRAHEKSSLRNPGYCWTRRLWRGPTGHTCLPERQRRLRRPLRERYHGPAIEVYPFQPSLPRIFRIAQKFEAVALPRSKNAFARRLLAELAKRLGSKEPEEIPAGVVGAALEAGDAGFAELGENATRARQLRNQGIEVRGVPKADDLLGTQVRDFLQKVGGICGGLQGLAGANFLDGEAEGFGENFGGLRGADIGTGDQDVWFRAKRAESQRCGAGLLHPFGGERALRLDGRFWVGAVHGDAVANDIKDHG